MSDFRRPILSPNGAANRAPKKVPALSIDTISDDCVGVMASASLLSLCPVEKWSSHHRIAMMPLIVLHVSMLAYRLSAVSRAQCLPGIVSKEYASESDERADHDRWRRGASHALGLSPWLPPCCHGYRHCRGVAPSMRQVVCIAQRVASVKYPSSNLLAVVGSRVEQSKWRRLREHQIRLRDEGSHWVD
jgi:hypothetical protein